MQSNWIKRIGALALCLVLLAADLAVFAGEAKAETYATYGDPLTDTTFFVTTGGLATLTLSQSGMGLAEKQNLYNAGQVTSEYTYAQYMVLYKGNMDAYWQQGAYWDDKTCALNFYRADVYTVRILPIVPQNMQPAASNKLTATWRYISWLTKPAWYVSGVKNCAISSVNPQKTVTPTPKPTKKPTATPTAVPVMPTGNSSCLIFYQTLDGRLLSWEQRFLARGTQLVLPNRTFNGYTLYGDGAFYVTVNAYGVASPETITFLYQESVTPKPTKKPTATPKPTKKPTATPTKKPTATPAVGYLTILYQTEDGSKVLAQERRRLTPGTHLINANKTIKGYTLINDGDIYVSVSSKGVVSPDQVIFRYRKNATSKPTATPVVGYLTVLFQTEDGSKVLDKERRRLTPGTHLINANKTIKGYTLINDGDIYVTVSSKGVVSPSQVVFRYRKNVTPKPTKKPTPKPTKKPTAKPTAAPIKGKLVQPVGWDTQFKGSSKNATRGKNVVNLFDNDRSTVLKWTIYAKEMGLDKQAQITVYFGGATIGAIGFRNGNAASQKDFNSFTRGTRYIARVYLTNGKYYDNTINLDGDTFRTDYQIIPLKKVYQNVDHIDLFLRKFTGGTTNKNATAIADLRFYTEP